MIPLYYDYLTPWVQSLYQQRKALQLGIQSVIRHSLVKQLHERQLDLLITIEPPKMGDLTSQLLGNFSLRLFSASRCEK